MTGDNVLYNETNDVASMDASIDIYTPAFIWNRSYLVPKRRTSDKQPANATDRRFGIDEIKEAIDEAILDFLRSKAGQGFLVDPTIDNNVLLFARVYEERTLRLGRRAVVVPAARLSTLGRRIFSLDERAIVLRGTYASPRAAYTLSIKIHIRTNLFTLSMVATPAQRRADAAVLSDATDFTYLTVQFWEELAQSVLTAFPDQRGRSSTMLQGIFADSRGLIISSHSIPERTETAARSSDSAHGWAEPVIDHLVPILSPADERGCTATYLLDKQALTVTTFGSQSTPQPTEPEPLTFVMCVHGDQLQQHEQAWARQLGHVMSRSHTITTMRLAALIDLKLLRVASVQLAQVEDKKALARERIIKYEGAEVEGESAYRAVDEVRKHLALINSNFLDANAAGVGLTFRIESSIYYIQEFRKHVDALKMSPIDGYQSYAQTIDRNIGIIFEFITRLGFRYDRLVTETQSIEQSFSTVQSRHTGNLIAELQRNGEFLLVSTLVPYYIMGIFAHVFGAPPEVNEPKDYTWRILNAAIWMACLYIAILRNSIAKHKPNKLREERARSAFAIRLGKWFAVVTVALCLYLYFSAVK